MYAYSPEIQINVEIETTISTWRGANQYSLLSENGPTGRGKLEEFDTATDNGTRTCVQTIMAWKKKTKKNRSYFRGTETAQW